MFDHRVRRLLDAPLTSAARALDRHGVTADQVTLAGLFFGLGSAAAAAGAWWWPALLMWWASRVCDGLDGPLARLRRARMPEDTTQAGGFLDITADFVVYGSTVVGVAWGVTSTTGQGWLPFAFVLLAYYVNGSAFLAFSSIAERTGRQLHDGRSLSFLGGLAEGTETIVVHSVWLLMPAQAGFIASIWAVVVGVGATHRIVIGYRALR